MKKIRRLEPNEIECRVGTISEKGLSLLLYKDARADMKILDEIYGPMNWTRKHELIGNNLFCTVSIWDSEKSQWISKTDVGTKSYSEAEKGEASDAFKRACVNIGIGRELYTAPFIWISSSKCNIQQRGSKYTTYDKFTVSSITYNKAGEIVSLTIVNQNGQIVYNLNGKPEMVYSAPTKEYEKTITKELERTGGELDKVLERYGISSIGEMSEDNYKHAINSLKRTKSKVA